MTAIVGLEYDGGVVLGGDSAFTDYHLTRTQLVESKVWQDGDYVMGSCGSWRLSQLLRHVLVLPAPPSDGEEDIDRFLALHFTDAVRATLLESGTVYSKNSIEQMDESDFLFGLQGKIYIMLNDFAVARSALGYIATGCGMDLAMGSLFTTQEWEDPVARVEVALEAAAAHNAGVMAPFDIIDMPYEPV